MRNLGLKRGEDVCSKGPYFQELLAEKNCVNSSVLHIIKHVSTVIVLTVMISLLYTLAHQYQAQRYVSFQIGSHMCAMSAADGKQSELCKIVNPGNGCHSF